VPNSRFDLGSTTLPYTRWTLDRALEGIARAGFRNVGLMRDHADGPIYSEQATAQELADLRRRIERHGLTPTLKFGPDSSKALPESLRRDVDAVAELGIPYLLLNPISPNPRFAKQRMGEMEWITRVEVWFQMLVPAIRRAERRGVTIVVKTHGGIAGTGEDLALVVERIGSPALRACYDPGNVVYYEGVRPEPDIANVADLTSVLIIKDHRGGQADLDFPTPGDGDIDHVSIFRTLHHANFAGPVLIERIDGLDTPEATDDALARGREYLERSVAEATSHA
jgi:sugar phosphate isomerase/epimerase